MHTFLTVGLIKRPDFKHFDPNSPIFPRPEKLTNSRLSPIPRSVRNPVHCSFQKEDKRVGATYVHGDTSDLRPAVPLGLVLVVRTTGLEQRLVDTTATGNNPCK